MVDLDVLVGDVLNEMIADGFYTPAPPLSLPDVPEPYGMQAAIIAHPATRKVINAGRRAGKTVMAALMAKDTFMAGKRVLLSSTSQDQADVFWEYVVRWLYPLLDVGMKKNETLRTLRWRGGYLKVKTGSKPDILRGGNWDRLVLDECAYLDPDAWYKVGAPMLADSGGDAIFISTPKRRNWFFHLYQKAIADNNPNWAAWHFTTLDNPHLDAEAVAALAADMTEADYEQEILARFLEGQGAVFRRVAEVCRGERQAPYSGRFVFGVDVASKGDFCVVMVIDADTRTVVDMDRFTGVSWAMLRGRISAMADKWQPERIVIESNSIGSPVIEALRDEGLPVRGFTTSAQSKPPLIESLVLAFERDEIVSLNDAVLVGELMAYERVVSSTGRSSYSAPSGLHDDCVMALAIAWQAVAQQGFRFLFDDDDAA